MSCNKIFSYKNTSEDQVGSFMHTGGKAILGLQNDHNFPKNSQVFQTLRFGRFPESVENRPRQEIQNPPTRTSGKPGNFEKVLGTLQPQVRLSTEYH